MFDGQRIVIQVKATDYELAKKQISDLHKIALERKMIKWAVEICFDYNKSLTERIVEEYILAAQTEVTDCIARFRHKSQAGYDPEAGFEGDEELRKNLSLAAVEHRAKLIDWEGDLYENHLEGIVGSEIIFSDHNFEGTPEDIYIRVENVMPNKKCIKKIVYKIKSPEDTFRIVKFGLQQKDCAYMGMTNNPKLHKYSVASRILGFICGSKLAYTSLDNSTAGGQVYAPLFYDSVLQIISEFGFPIKDKLTVKDLDFVWNWHEQIKSKLYPELL